MSLKPSRDELLPDALRNDLLEGSLPPHALTVTQEFIANLLGVRREGVTESAGKLRKAGLISSHRGRITICDRKSLKARGCDFY